MCDNVRGSHAQRAVHGAVAGGRCTVGSGAAMRASAVATCHAPPHA